MTAESMRQWVNDHHIKILHGATGTGFAREWDDFVSVNDRRHLAVIQRDMTLAGTEKAIREFCAMHNLPLPQ